MILDPEDFESRLDFIFDRAKDRLKQEIKNPIETTP